MVYSILGVVGPRAAAALAALSLGSCGSHLSSSLHGTCQVGRLVLVSVNAASRWTTSLKVNITKCKRRPKVLVEFFFSPPSFF